MILCFIPESFIFDISASLDIVPCLNSLQAPSFGITRAKPLSTRRLISLMAASVFSTMEG